MRVLLTDVHHIAVEGGLSVVDGSIKALSLYVAAGMSSQQLDYIQLLLNSVLVIHFYLVCLTLVSSMPK